jgi:hypothetical protein
VSDEGTVRFNVPAVSPEAGPVVEIRDHNLRLLDPAQPGQEIQLEAGIYLASVVLPSGESEQQAIEVAPGKPIDIDLGPDASTLAEDPLAAHEAALEADLPRDLVLPAGAPSETSRPAQEWFGRLLRTIDGAPIEADHVFEARGYAPEPLSEVTDLLCGAPRGADDGLVYLQVAVPNRVPFSCVLPIVPGAGPQQCRVRVVTTADAIRATALPLGNELTESIAAYLATGHLNQAAHAVANAKELLFGKVSDPVGAALGGYALLRLGRLDEVEHWVENLANWIAVLPDGAVIAAEQAARNGRKHEAERWLDEAVGRGTPMFADGLSLLVTRLRPRCSKEPVDKDAVRILDIATRADFAQTVVAFWSADPLRPAETDYALDSFDPEEGWQRFRHGEPARVEAVRA